MAALNLLNPGLVLLYLYAVLPTAALRALLSPACTTFDHAGGKIELPEGQNTSLTIWAMRSECEDPACIAANTNCTTACTDCAGYDGAVNMTLAGQGLNASAIPGLACNIANATNGSVGSWPVTCITGNSLAGQSGYSLVLTIKDDTGNTVATKSAGIKFIAGDVVVGNCLGIFDSGTDKAYLASDNVFQIWLKDTWNNTVGAGTYRLGITPVPFTITVTWNPDDGTKVILGQTPTVDTTGDNGYYTASINPTKIGNYLAKTDSNGTVIHNSPFAFQVLKGKKASANLLRPPFLGSGLWCFCLSVVYMAVVSITTGPLM